MSESVGRIDLDLGVNTKGFKKEMRGLGRTAKNESGVITKALGGIGKAAAVAFSLNAIKNFAKECLDLGSDLAEVQNVVDVTFGTMSEKVNQFAKDAMASYGMSEKVAKEYMGQLGAMSKAFGNTEAMAYDQAAALTGLAGDVASFYNMSTDEAFTKLKAVYTGETEGLKALGVVMTQSALDAFAMAKGFGKTTAEMSEQEKVALRLAFVQDKLAGASGDFARTADGWANQTRVLALRFDAIKASIGQGLINVLLPVIRLLNEFVARLQVAADAFAQFTTTLFGDSGGASSQMAGVAAATETVAESLGEGASAAKAIKKSLAGFDQINVLSGGGSDSGSSASSGGGSIDTGSVVESETQATEGAVGKLKGFLEEAKRAFTEFSKVSGLADFWGKIVEGAGYAKTGVLNLFESFKGAIAENTPNFEELKTSVTNTFLSMSQALTTIYGDLWLSCMQAFASFTEEHGPAIQEFFSGVIRTVTDAGTLITDVVGGVYESILEWWNSSGKPVWAGIVSALKDIGGWFLDIWNGWIQPVIDTIMDVLQDLWTNHLQPLWREILEVISSIGNFLLALWNKRLKPVVDWLIATLGPVFSNVFSNIAKIVGSVIGGVIDWIKAALKAFRGIIDFITGVFSGDWKKAWNGIKTWFGSLWDGMVARIKTPINAIIGMFEGLVNGVIGAVNGIIRALNKLNIKVPDWVPGLGGKNFGFNISEIRNLSIPRLASGGYVAANTPQLAVVGDNRREGEIIAPESKIAEAVAKGFSMVLAKMQGQTAAQNDRPMYVTIKLGEGTFWEGFVDYHNSEVKRTGASPLLV